MKYILLMFLALPISLSAQDGPADSIHTDAPKEDPEVVEVMPEYPGGMMEMIKFIYKKQKYPKSARRMGIEGVVFTAFVINVDGTVSDIEIERGVSKELDDEAKRIVRMFPKWTPGMQNGKPVKVKFVVPVKFKLRKK